MPEHNRPIPLSSVTVGEPEIRAVSDAMRSGAVSGTGPAVARFEEWGRGFTTREYASAVNSGTSGLIAALAACGVRPGDNVLVPAVTFAAPASAAIAVHARPLLVDVREDTWCIDVEDAARKMTSDTSAVIAVDVMGNPCDYSALAGLGLPVIEDAAEALGSAYNGRRCGAWGDASVFSFHANKVLTSGEGGMVTTDCEDISAYVRSYLNHGMGPGYIHERAGQNFRMPNLAAAFAVGQSERIVSLMERRQIIEAHYRELLDGLPFTWQEVTRGAFRQTWLVSLRTSVRTKLLTALRENRIDARPVWPALSQQPFLAPYQTSCPVAEMLTAECLWLPTFFDLQVEDIQRIARVIVGSLQSQ